MILLIKTYYPSFIRVPYHINYKYHLQQQGLISDRGEILILSAGENGTESYPSNKRQSNGTTRYTERKRESTLYVTCFRNLHKRVKPIHEETRRSPFRTGSNHDEKVGPRTLLFCTCHFVTIERPNIRSLCTNDNIQWSLNPNEQYRYVKLNCVYVLY